MSSRAVTLASFASILIGSTLFACVGDSTAPTDAGSDTSTGKDATADVGNDVTTSDAGDGAVAFTPTSIAGLRLWFEGDKGVDLGDGGTDAGTNVTVWHDQSGNAEDAVPHASTTQYLPACPAPVLAKSAINNKDALDFTPATSGVYPCLQLPSGFSDFTTGATVFAVARINLATAQAKFLAFGLLQSPNIDPANPLHQVGFQRGASNLFIDNWEDQVSGDFTTLSSATTSAGNVKEVHVFEFVLNAGAANTVASGSMFMDGNPLSPGTDTKPLVVPQVVSRNMNTISWAGRTADQIYGQLGELLMYGAPLKTAERLSVEQYLRSKWGTP